MPVSNLVSSFFWYIFMKPKKHHRRDADLFRERLDVIIDMSHKLTRLTAMIPWQEFDEAFGKHYKPLGRPAKPTRLMVGLHYLKHMHAHSDAKRPLFPIQSGHRFRFNPATDSDAKRPVRLGVLLTLPE